jgi:hypothetical protein
MPRSMMNNDRRCRTSGAIWRVQTTLSGAAWRTNGAVWRVQTTFSGAAWRINWKNSMWRRHARYQHGIVNRLTANGQLWHVDFSRTRA